jgi:hypothetical protein
MISSTVSRFYKNIDVKGFDDCWNWLLSKNRCGYGKFKAFGKSYLSHRFMYELEHLCIPEGMIVMHTCDNPACCNPNHLVLGTQKENVGDCWGKGRHNNINLKRKKQPKLKRDDVMLIRELHDDGYSHKYIANLFDISKSQVYIIVNNRQWKEIV